MSKGLHLIRALMPEIKHNKDWHMTREAIDDALNATNQRARALAAIKERFPDARRHFGFGTEVWITYHLKTDECDSFLVAPFPSAKTGAHLSVGVRIEGIFVTHAEWSVAFDEQFAALEDADEEAALQVVRALAHGAALAAVKRLAKAST